MKQRFKKRDLYQHSERGWGGVETEDRQREKDRHTDTGGDGDRDINTEKLSMAELAG